MKLILAATLLVIAPTHALADGSVPVERIALDPAWVARLVAVAPGESTELSAWPLEPGHRGDVLLTRRAVYAPDASIHVVDGDASRDEPRSRLAFLFGEVVGDEGTRLLVSIDPQAMRLHAFTLTSEGWTELRPAAAESSHDYLLAPSAGFLDPLTEPESVTCGQGGPGDASTDAPFRLDAIAPGVAAVTSLRQITLAVDTDNEFMDLKFANNTANATSYIATLFALMTVIYERDLEVRVLQGTTTLRVSTTADPYLQSGTGNADSAKIQEFRDYWEANYGGVARAAAMLLSGKQAIANSASGIGYVDSLCSTNRGYTFTQVFKYSGSSASSDVKTVAHEVGHNFGSAHTHCYLDPTPIDTCYSGASGCYSGVTSCPAPQTINGVANVRGTLMSYCHTLSGCSSSTVLHPRTVSLLAPIVASKVGVCVFPVAGANPKEASPEGAMTAQRGTAGSVAVTYIPACGASQHTVYAGNLNTLRPGGLAWSQRFCSLGVSGSLSFTPSGDVYFVVAGNNGTTEGSYGRTTTAERPAAGSGGACSYAQDLSGTCP